MSRRRRLGLGGRVSSSLLLLLLPPSIAAAEPAVPYPVEAAAESGLDFVHWNGMTGRLYYSEVLGSGAALFDVDGDGDLDAFLVQGALLDPAERLADALFPPPPGFELGSRLFRNDLVEVDSSGARRLRFTDVTAASGIRARGYGMGVATGDFDNDGHLDLYLTNLGPDQLWRNRGDSTFEDVTARSGVDEPRWSTSATFFDYDRDGWLDLFVAANIDFSVEKHTTCYGPSSAPVYCGPDSYPPLADRLWRNRGDGTFEDVTMGAGLGQARGAGLGVVAFDFDADGWQDLYVANDASENRLWRNRGDGTFEDLALLAGCAVNLQGGAEAGMGVDAADYDGDGDFDLFLSHLRGETNTLYRHDGAGGFEDATLLSGLGAPSFPYTGFGTGWLDFDGDGRPDLVVANGSIKALAELVAAGDPFPLHQPNQLFRNLGGGRFAEVTAAAGAAFALSEVSRGLALGDVDNDGDTDALTTNNNGPARLLLSRADPARPWLGLRLLTAEGRDALGARLEIRQAGAPPTFERAASDGSYLSAGDPRVLVTLRASASASASVHWPDGTAETFSGLAAGRYHTLRQGSGDGAGGRGEEGGTSAAELEKRVAPLEKRVAPLQLEKRVAPLGLQPSGEEDGTFSHPSLEGLEPGVAVHLREARAALEEALGDSAARGKGRLGRSWGELGRRYQVYGFHRAARVAYLEAGRLLPEEAEWAWALGQVLRLEGRWQEAAAAFERALALQPDDLPSLFWLAQCRLELGELGAARALIERLLARDPSAAAAHAVLAQIATAKGEHAAAVEHYRRALELQPAATRLHGPLALAYRALGEAEAAARHLALRGQGKPILADPWVKELEESSRSSRFFLERGDDELSLGLAAEAEASFRKVLALGGESVETRNGLAAALAARGELEAAITELRRALSIDPEHALARFNLGTLLARAGRKEAAREAYERALALDPELEGAHFNLANLLRRSGEPAAALRHYRRAAELASGESAPRLGEVLCLVDLERHAEALRSAEEAHGAFPEDLSLANALARLLATSPVAELRDGRRALALAERLFAAERTLDHVETLAMAWAQVGAFARAVYWQEQAIRVAARAGRPDRAELLAQALDLYRAGLPSRRAW